MDSELKVKAGHNGRVLSVADHGINKQAIKQINSDKIAPTPEIPTNIEAICECIDQGGPLPIFAIDAKRQTAKKLIDDAREAEWASSEAAVSIRDARAIGAPAVFGGSYGLFVGISVFPMLYLNQAAQQQ